MPGRNGTGPEGKGPMTGRKMGLCNSGDNNAEAKNSVYAFGRGNRPAGAGRGLGRRQGRRGL